MHARVKSREKALRVLGGVRAALGAELEVESCERNPDDSALYRIDAASALGAEGVEEAVFRALTAAGRLAVWWTVNGPELSPDGLWVFRGLTRPPALRISGVEAAGFEVAGRSPEPARAAGPPAPHVAT